jgi:hypothetical protein
MHILQEHRSMLWGHKIRVYTDHSNLQFEKSSSEQILCQKLVLEEFALEIIIVKGKDNIVTDALSRLDFKDELSMLTIAPVIAECSLDWKDLQKAQEGLENVPDTQYMEVAGVRLITYQGRVLLRRDYGLKLITLYYTWLSHSGTSKLYKTLRSAFV